MKYIHRRKGNYILQHCSFQFENVRVLQIRKLVYILPLERNGHCFIKKQYANWHANGELPKKAFPKSI